MTVLLLGVPSEPPVRAVAEALTALGEAPVVWNQRAVADSHVDLALGRGGAVAGVFDTGDQRLALEEVVGVYLRPTDNATLPELAGRAADDPQVVHADAVLEGLLAFCEITPARVVNRLGSPDANNSKPLQAQLIAPFFRVPDVLVTDDPELVVEFWQRHGRVVYKSISGERSVVTELTDADRHRLDAVRRCPVQFQQHVGGLDVRVHVLLSGDVHATAAAGDTIDYRYATGSAARMWPIEVPAEVASGCLALTAALGLDLAGIDLKFTPDGEVYCFEVNPSPAFSAFEEATGQPIAAAVARYLLGSD